MINDTPKALAIARALALNDFRDFSALICVPQRIWTGPRGSRNNLCGLPNHFYVYGPAMNIDAPLVHVVIDGDVMLTIRSRSHGTMHLFLNSTCTVCCMTLLSCGCPMFVPRRGGHWTFSTGTEEPYRTSTYHRRWLANNQIFADWNPDQEDNVLQGYERILDPTGDSVQDLVKIMEDVGTFMYYYKTMKTIQDFAIALTSFVRSVTGQSVVVLHIKFFKYLNNEFITEFARNHFDNNCQSGPTSFEKLWDNYSMLKTSPIGQKLLLILSHSIIGALLMKAGFEPDTEKVRLLYDKKIQPSMKDYVTLVDAIGNLIVFTLKQGRQYMLTGDINCFFIDGDSITDWITTAKKLKANFEFLSNPEAINLEVFSYLKDLKQAIEDGNSIIKTTKSGTTEHKIITSMTIELTTLEKRYLCLNAALSMRKQPLGIVLYGAPGVGKSFITDKICKKYASLFNLDPSPAYRFNHCSEDDYFTNFRSFMHTIILDDIAQQLPARVTGVDKSLSTIIKIFNNQPFSPPQAAIDDKGKTPMLCELGIVTTNVLNMNIPHYFSAVYAVMRRLPIHIEPKLKPEFSTNGVLDDTKIGDNENLWDFIIREPVYTPTSDSEGTNVNMNSKYEVVKTLTTMKELWDYLTPIMVEHRRKQSKVLESNEDLCKDCKYIKSMCICETLQSNELCPNCYAELNNCYCNDDPNTEDGLFEISYPEEECPWRIDGTKDFKRSRRFTPLMAKIFQRNMHKIYKTDFDKGIVNNYAHMFLPDLMRRGYDDTLIREDFVRYHAFMLNNRDGNHYFNSLHNDNIFSGWKYYLLKFVTYLYYEFSIFRWLLCYCLNYSWTRYFIIMTHNMIISSGSRRAKYMKNFGKYVDERLCKSSMSTHFITVVSTIFVTSILANTYLQSVRTKEKERNFIMTKSKRHNFYEFSDKLRDKYVTKISRLEKYIQMMERTHPRNLNKTHACSDSCSTICDYNPHENPYQCSVVDEEPEDCFSTSSSEPACLQALYDDIHTPVSVNAHSFGKDPPSAPYDDVVNVWKKDTRLVTSVDFHPQRATTLEACMKSLTRSCVTIGVVSETSAGVAIYEGRAICLNSSTIMVNAHAIPKTKFQLKIQLMYSADLGPNIEGYIDPSQVIRNDFRDLVIIKTKMLPMMFNNISRQFPNTSFDGVYDGFYMVIQPNGEFEKIIVNKIHKTLVDTIASGVHIKMECYAGYPERSTESGECGSPLFMDTGFGPILVGYHFMYKNSMGMCYATKIVQEDLEEFLKDDIEVQCTRIDVPFPLEKANISFCDFHTRGALMYHGDIGQSAIRGKTRVKKTSIADFIFQQTDFEDFRFEDDFSEPSMHRWKPQQKALTEYLSPANGMNEVVIASCASVLLDNIMRNLPVEELKLIHPVNINVAINGKPGVAYIDGIQRGTSMGWPFHTTKRKYLEKLEDISWPDGVRFCPEVEERIQKVIDMYCSGLRIHPVFSANLKDEVVSKKKRVNFKTRVFFSCPTEFLIVVRMVFLGFTRVVQRNWKIFHCVIGINNASTQWDELYHELTKFGLDHMIAGDFAGFDKKFYIGFQRWAFWAIKQICIKSGNFTDIHIRVMECIEADLTNPTVNWFGMIITLLGGEVSGHQLTTVFNCFCCILYIMYCYAQVYEISTFFDNVVIFSLGDDHVVAVKDSCLEFNHTRIQSILVSAGVGYTMAEKERASQPFIHISEVTFLKRRFVYSNVFGKVVAPLDARSIIKMLTYHVKSKTVSENSQIAQAMVSASMEAFFHGRDSFEYLEFILEGCPKSDALELYIRDFPRFTWEENIDRYWAASSKYYKTESKTLHSKSGCVLNGSITTAYGTSLNQKNPLFNSYCRASHSQSYDSLSMDSRGKLARAFPKVRIYGRDQLVLKSIAKDARNESRVCHENLGLANTSQTIGNDLPSSSEVPVASNEVIEEQTYFIDNNKDTSLDLATPHDPIAAQMALIPDLSSYLSRPAKIWQYTWNVGAGVGLLTSLNPWSLFFNVAPIKNKLQNFRFIRCNLHVKFVINASPFYYGSIGAFYQPLVTDLGDKSGSATGYVAGRQVVVSQRNHVWLNPQSVTSAEIVLPFLHYRNFLDLNTNSASINMGELGIWEYAALASANGVTTGGVTINAYAWATEVELAGASSAPILQGKQYNAGPVSGPASTVKAIAGRLKDIPVIGPFATATEVVSGAIGDVAKFFGYTNVPITDDVKPYKPTAFHTLASSQISEPINKLSLQPDAETTVGMFHGDKLSDPLVLKDFVSRESFLCGTAWSTTNVEDDILFTTAVTPELFEFGGTGSQLATFPTPMSFASNFFQYWNGDIIFKFRVIKSQYHRGRLNICWDAGINAAISMPSTGSPAVFNVILDLDEEDEVEIRVPYTQSAPFLALSQGTTANWSNGPSPTFSYAGNGTLQVRVLNTLSAPVSTSGIVVQVFVSGADNLQFGCPINLYQYESLYQLQGRKVEFNDQTINADCFQEMFGENIISFRELLHRQTKACTFNIDKDLQFSAWTGDYMDVNFPINRIPRAFGYALNGWSLAVPTVGAAPSYPFNYVRVHPLIRLLGCFVGYKGSVNWTINARYVGDNGNRNLPHMSICRKTDRANAKPNGAGFANSFSKSSIAYHLNDEGWSIDSSGAAGIALTNQNTQAGLSANLPYYNNYKFQVCNFNSIYNTATSGWGVEKDYYNLHVFRKITSGSPDNDLTLDAYCGTGPDFDFVYFLNCPVLYWRAASPDPF